MAFCFTLSKGLRLTIDSEPDEAVVLVTALGTDLPDQTGRDRLRDLVLTVFDVEIVTFCLTEEKNTCSCLGSFALFQ